MIWRDRRCVMAMSGRCSEVWLVSEPLKRSQSRGTDALRKVGAYIGRPVKNIWQVTCWGPFGLEPHNRKSGARSRHPKTLAPPPPACASHSHLRRRPPAFNQDPRQVRRPSHQVRRGLYSSSGCSVRIHRSTSVRNPLAKLATSAASLSETVPPIS